jgi:hypothetical protein
MFFQPPDSGNREFADMFVGNGREIGPEVGLR